MMALRAVAGLGLGLAAATAHMPSSHPAASVPDEPQRLVNFDFERPGLAVAHWSIQINEDGTGRYNDLSDPQHGSATAGRPIRVGMATHHRLEAGFDKVSAGNCETSTKHLANTGAKRIAYRNGGDNWVSCTFNYSDDKALMDTAAAFQALAATLQQGDQLEHSHRYDRLGLDAEIDELGKEVSEGEVIELENIAPVLQEIVEDERVIDRVRRKSARLLQDAGVLSPPAVRTSAAPVESSEPRESSEFRADAAPRESADRRER